MLEHCKNIKERWIGISEIVDRWLQQRQELIVEFCTVSGVHALAGDSADHSSGLKHFCELTVDYVSAGHFEIYDHLIQESEDLGDSGALELAQTLYPSISETTEHVLKFNDNLDDLIDGKTDTNLARELSVLGEKLVERFELEDQLVDKLHFSHKELLEQAS